MSVSFGGLGLMSFRNPFADVVGALWGKGDIRSMFWLIVFAIVCLVLAYLTNPSETSFRTFLTEQSFRQHLSRLDDNLDDNDNDHDISVQRPTIARHTHTHTLPFDNRSPFHFANRASVSLRTPKHVFHSFGIFTIAAIIPIAKSERIATKSLEHASVICDSWYVGVFGRWWRGGVLEAWYQDVFARTNDEESWSSGILGMKTTERHTEYSGLPFSTKNLPPHLLSRSPPRLRNRDKSSQRSSTPPPLPKSVSLPLHATRSSGELNIVAPPLAQPPSKNTFVESAAAGTQGHSLDQSPRVIELLHQVSTSKASILELRTQLTDCRTTASQSQVVLNEELEACREKKRQEDAVRNDLKTRTKTLDDAKRQAESQKRDAEKRLKSVTSRRQDTRQHIEHIDAEVARLRRSIKEQSSTSPAQETSQAEQEIQAALAEKHREIDSGEDVVTALNLRAKDLEDKLIAQRERLQLIRDRVQYLENQHIQSFPSVDPIPSPWPNSHDSPPVPHHTIPEYSHADLPVTPDRLVGPEVSPDVHIVFGGHEHNNIQPLDIPRLKPITSNFSPFAELDQPQPTVISPTSSNLIPAGLMSSLALDNLDTVSRSFQSESDTFLDRHWRNDGIVHGAPHRTFEDGLPRRDTHSSPTSLHGPIGSDTEYDPFEVRMLSPHEREHFSMRTESAMDMQRASLLPRSHAPLVYPVEDVSIEEDKVPTHRRWFSSSSRDKTKKGLNPDAKAFNLSRKSRSSHTGMSFDALNPHGHGLGHHHFLTPASDNTTLLRAFAPSAAEREVLQRALGGSTNTSLERLPSLSDTISIPPSPSHVHAHAHAPSTMDKIPAWLQSLPRIRKTTNFSPWDDDEPMRKSG